MNIALCADENYAFPCGVCVTSILENNIHEKCNIYILTPGLKEESKKKFKELSKTYGQSIEIIAIDDTLFQDLKRCKRFPQSIYYRFLIPHLLPVNKILYLDCDIIVTQSLKSLWETGISEYACAVVEDQKSDDIRLQNNLELYKKYFNSGVLLMNLEYWRKNNTSQKLTNFIDNNTEKCVYPDQDALNYILGEKVLYLEYKYNYQEFMLYPKEEQFLHKVKWGNLLPANELPAIIHYTCDIKPWIKNCRHPLKGEFFKYKKISPWKSCKTKKLFSFVEKLRMIYQITSFILKDKNTKRTMI